MIRYPDAELGPWGIRANWVNIDGRPECAGLVIWYGADQAHRSPLDYVPFTEVQGITATGIAALPIATIIDKLRLAARDHWRRQQSRMEEMFADRPDMAVLLEPSSFESTARSIGAPVRYSRAHYVDVATAYLRAWQHDLNPTQAVVEQFGVSRSAAAKWVRKARSDDLRLLTPAEQGKPGARPGPGWTADEHKDLIARLNADRKKAGEAND